MARPRIIAGAVAAVLVATSAVVAPRLLAPAPMSVSATCATPPAAFPASAIWCFPTGIPAPLSRIIDNKGGWLDTFDTGVSLGRFIQGDDDYVISNHGDAGDPLGLRSQAFVHANHWMIDMQDNAQYGQKGGLVVSPNKLFPFENGRLVIETDMAAGDTTMMGGADTFYEIDISPSRPTGIQVDSLYSYGSFGGVGSIGCRFQNDGGLQQRCAKYDSSTRDAGGLDHSVACTNPPYGCPPGIPGRMWETQGSQGYIAAVGPNGGGPGLPLLDNSGLKSDDVARLCDPLTNPAATMPDQFCRDRIRMVFDLNDQSITIYVNGFEWFRMAGLYASGPGEPGKGLPAGLDNRIPPAWASGVYVYFSSWQNAAGPAVHRWHWDRAMVNAHDPSGNILPLSAAPSYCFGAQFNTCPQPTPKPSATPTPSGTSSATPSPTTTVSPSPTRTASPSPSSTPTASPSPTPPVLGTCMAMFNGNVIESKQTTQANCHLQ